MMSDLDKMVKTFNELGVEYKVKTALEEYGRDIHLISYDGEIMYDKYIKIKHGIGYYDFYCKFYFLAGKYQGHGVWE